jgi:tellurite methyltransferase
MGRPPQRKIDRSTWFRAGAVTQSLRDRFGDIDIYLFDQMLRGRIRPGMRIVDAGCGGGRNLVYLLQAGYDVCAADADPRAVQAVRELVERFAPGLPSENIRVEAVEAMSFPEGCADFLISSAVLHFARDADHFDAMLERMWRVMAPGGTLFCRTASSIGIEGRVRAIGSGRYLLPDGSERYLVDEARLLDRTTMLGARLCDPIKTTVVQDQRSMTTWVVGKM